jgi:hypothetical protein
VEGDKMAEEIVVNIGDAAKVVEVGYEDVVNEEGKTSNQKFVLTEEGGYPNVRRQKFVGEEQIDKLPYNIKQQIEKFGETGGTLATKEDVVKNPKKEEKEDKPQKNLSLRDYELLDTAPKEVSKKKLENPFPKPYLE